MEEDGSLMGIQVCREARSVSHLVFADNSLILMKVNYANAKCLKDILDNYCASSGQLVIVGKSSVYFSPNIGAEVREEVYTIHIMTEAISARYL
jgi:hypothetical protein